MILHVDLHKFPNAPSFQIHEVFPYLFVTGFINIQLHLWQTVSFTTLYSKTFPFRKRYWDLKYCLLTIIICALISIFQIELYIIIKELCFYVPILRGLNLFFSITSRHTLDKEKKITLQYHPWNKIHTAKKSHQQAIKT